MGRYFEEEITTLCPFYRSNVFLADSFSKNQVPLGSTALSQVSKALDSGDPALVRRLSSYDSLSDQHQCINQKQQLCSDGSYDILDAEDLSDPGN